MPEWTVDYERVPFRMIAASFALGAMPMAFAVYFLRPFVASAALTNVPVSARRSLNHLHRWAENLPYGTEIEFKMFHYWALFRRVSVPVGELKTRRKGWNVLAMENLVRRGGLRSDTKRFFMPGERKVNLRTRLWNIIQPQLGSVEELKKESMGK